MTQLTLDQVMVEFLNHERKQMEWADKWVKAKDEYEALNDHADKVHAEEMIKNMDLPQWKCSALADASKEYQSALELKRTVAKSMNTAKMGFEVAVNAGEYYRSSCSVSKAEARL